MGHGPWGPRGPGHFAERLSQKIAFLAQNLDLGFTECVNKLRLRGVHPAWTPVNNSVEFGFNIAQNGWMATQLVTKKCDFGSLGVPGPASTPKPTNQSINQSFFFPSSPAMCGHHASQFGLICFILIRFSKQWFYLGDPPSEGPITWC